ncbi:MAG: hypothetical protein EAX90_00515 [Candidatus Heimdallarchaeota archaeon]|nr:hypothetical protein [Candidatus Heimdallarchaeota archaeon]
MFKPDYSKGKAYLKKAGTNVFAIAGGIKMVFSPGSAYKDIKKEKLPERFFIESLKKEFSFSKSFIKQYQVTHHVDMERLLRACSILITHFTGPETEDYMKNHSQRLFTNFMIKPGIICEDEVRAALISFGEVLKIKNKPKISLGEYLDAAKIIGDYFKLWSYDDAIDAFFGTM